MNSGKLHTFRALFGFFLLAIFFVGSAKAVSFSFGTVPIATGDCITNMVIRYNMTATGLVDDQFGQDYHTVVVYDAYGTKLFFINHGVAVGSSFSFLDLVATNNLLIPTARPFTLKAYDTSVGATNFTEAENGPLLDTVVFDPAPLGVCTTIPLRIFPSPSNPENPQPAFSDGRINNWDTASPVVLFGHDGETGRGLVIYSPEGELLLVVSAEDIADVEECPEVNTLIASAEDVALYRLIDCRYQLNALALDGTKTYVLIFNDLYENTGYTSYEE